MMTQMSVLKSASTRHVEPHFAHHAAFFRDRQARLNIRASRVLDKSGLVDERSGVCAATLTD